MSDMLSAIHDDIEWYLELCAKYKEKPEHSHGSVNPYGLHARKLKQRYAKECL